MFQLWIVTWFQGMFIDHNVASYFQIAMMVSFGFIAAPTVIKFVVSTASSLLSDSLITYEERKYRKQHDQLERRKKLIKLQSDLNAEKTSIIREEKELEAKEEIAHVTG
ncbi:MAG: hypothetical protein PHQ86_07090 [Dehalococcoidales bacterium]|nr:hypothetical protein [Dehalococcoidales bacterium]